MAELPINNGFWVQSGEERLYYSPATDSIHLFPDNPEYDHVVFWNEEKKQMTYHWLGRAGLDTLHEAGLGHTVRDSITEYELETYENYYIETETEALDEEIDELLNGN